VEWHPGWAASGASELAEAIRRPSWRGAGAFRPGGAVGNASELAVESYVLVERRLRAFSRLL